MKKLFFLSSRRSASFLRRLGRLIDDVRQKEKRNSGAEAIKKTDIRCKCYLAGRVVVGDKRETEGWMKKKLDDEREIEHTMKRGKGRGGGRVLLST